MASYLEEMLKINKVFIRMYPNKIIYQQIDEGEVPYCQPINTYLVDYLHANGLYPSYESMMDYASNSIEWEKDRYSRSEYVGDCAVSIEMESWKYDTKEKYAVRTVNGKKYIKTIYRVHRQINHRSSKTRMVFQTYYEHKLLQYLFKTSFNDVCADIDGEEDCEISDEEIGKEFVRHCKSFKMKIEDDYVYGYIRKCVYVETYDDDMGCIQFMLYDESKDDWVVVYKTYDMEDMVSKLQYITENDLWDTSYDYYSKEDRWWRKGR